MKAYMLFSSSGGNSAYIKSGNEEILIDAGVSAKRISDSLKKLGTSMENISKIFITHEHSDHIKALNVLCRHYRIPIYAPTGSIDFIARTMPWTDDLLVENNGGSVVETSNMRITSFETPHDSLGSVCFRIQGDKSTLGYATDIGHITPEVKNALTGCENIVIESNYDLNMLKNGDYPYQIKKRIMGDYGHLSNSSCASFLPYLACTGSKNFVLAHLSENNNKPIFALGECRGTLNGAGITTDEDFGKSDVRLCVSERDGIVEIF